MTKLDNTLQGSLQAVSLRGTNVPSLKDIGCFVWNKILLWPRAVLFHLPLIFRNIRQIKLVYDALYPEAIKVHKSCSSVFSFPIFYTETTRLLIEKLNEAETALSGISHQEVFAYLKDKGDKFHKLAVFMHEIFLASDGTCSDMDIVEEASSTIKLLADLIEDLSTREGFLSAGKKRESPKVSVSPLIETRPRPIATFDPTQEDVIEEATKKLPTVGPKMIWIKSLEKQVDPIDHKETISMDDSKDQELLKTIQRIQNKHPLTIKNAFMNFFRFIFIDLLVGIPKFFLIELPEMLINFQRRLQDTVDHLDQFAHTFLSLRNDLLALFKLIDSFKFLEPFFHGLFLFLKEHDLKDSQAIFSKFDALFDNMCKQLDEADLEKIQGMVVDLKALLKRVKPMLENILAAINGRSIAAVITPNPLGGMFKTPTATRSASFVDVAGEKASSGESLTPSVTGSDRDQVVAPKSVAEVFGAIRSVFSVPKP